MAFFEGCFYSVCLQKQVLVNIVLPNDAPPFLKDSNPNYARETKVFYLLHGMSENSKSIMNGSSIVDLAVKYNIAVIMPSCDNSFYLNQAGSGRAYETYVAKELRDYVCKTFGLSNKKEDNFVGGFSMGGFGALHTGLKYADCYEKIMAFSPALIVNEIKNQKPGFNNGVADYDYYASTFGDLDALEESENNPAYLVKKLLKENQQVPPIFHVCGTEDFLLEKNREFHQFMVDVGAEEDYRESPGVHDWLFWNSKLETAIRWALDQE